MSIRRSGRFLSRTLGVFGLAVGMLAAGGLALGADAPTTRPTSAPTLAQIDWRKGFILHQPRRYAVLIQNHLRSPGTLWPKPEYTARGILTVTLTDRKEDGTCLFECQIKLEAAVVKEKPVPPPPVKRLSFSTSPTGQIRIDPQAVKQALNPTGKWEYPGQMAGFIFSGIQLICYPLPPASAQTPGDELQWKGDLFAHALPFQWQAGESGGLLHVEGQLTSGDTEWRMFNSYHYRTTLFENHLLYGASTWTTLRQGEVTAITQLQVYPLPPQAKPTTAPATSPAPPSER